MKKLRLTFIGIGFSVMTFAQSLYSSKAFQVEKDKVVQGKYESKALSPTHLVSNYQSPVNQFQSATISFKFSINGRDNEMLSGKDHHFTVIAKNGKAETPIIHFGKQFQEVARDEHYLEPNTELKIKLDCKDVQRQFNEKGYYTTFNGDKIYKEDFKGIFIAGGSAPLIWDFDNLQRHSELQLHDEDGDGIYEIDITLNKQSDEKYTDAEWKLTKDISAYPQYNSSYPISDAVYNLSLEEMLKAIEKDSTFRTGKEWAGVWTRDISYSIILSMAYLQPQVAKNSLRKKVNKKKRIIQDTGTGGAWPASTDRMIWAVAAWEIYIVTGDRGWLEEAYEIIKNTIEDDLQNVYDKNTGLVKGESSFLDWREQTYPKWMQPADIFESECLGTNAVHYQANKVLAKMAIVLDKKSVATKHDAIASTIKNGINKYLWLPEKKYYAQFLYGRNYKLVSSRAEALGEALCILFGIADAERARQIVSHTPVTDFGISCIYPQIPNIPPYHNNAIWPFVQTYWLWAAAKTGNEKSVAESIMDIYRPAALFLTNKENFVADNGDFNGTQINSSIMLWSLSGNLSIIHKVLFGIHFEEDRLTFKPFVPKSLSGNRSLINFKYRESVLDIEMQGYGNKISSFFIDGKPTDNYYLLANTKGRHTIKIVLANTESGNTINKLPNYTTLKAPQVQYQNNTINWEPVEGAKSYTIIENGKAIASINSTKWTVNDKSFHEYAVLAKDEKGIESFISEPVGVYTNDNSIKIEFENFVTPASYSYKGFSGTGFVETTTTVNSTIQIPIDVANPGEYSIDITYANGNGPTNTENKCAIRTAKIDNIHSGIFVFPQRGKEEWSNWGFSNAIQAKLTKGRHILSISLENENDNMNELINTAMLDFVRVTKMK